ncbi:MAG TPA: pro-sigmaK processing inhibitor BofA family protein [Bacillota bacterium]
MSNGLILAYLVILALLYVLGKNFWKPLFVLFSLFFQGALGALGLYLFNMVAAAWQVEVPLNPFNALFTGFLGVPGLLALLALRYWIKI